MAEREARTVGHDQLQRRASVQGRGDLRVRDSGGRCQQPPVKTAAEDCRGAHHCPLAVIQAGQPGSHGISESGRDCAQIPGGQQILHQQGQALGIPDHHFDYLIQQRPCPGAGTSHVPGLVVCETADRAYRCASRLQ